MMKFKYIANLTLDEIDSSVVIPCIDEQGNHALLIRNALEKSVTTNFSTDNLNVKIDTMLYVGVKCFYFHIISSNKNDLYSIGQFEIIYEYIFKKIKDPITGNELSALVTSIEDYFRTTPEKDLFSIQVGVFGELFAIKYLYENGYENIVDKYHQNFYSKHDIELDTKNRIEIKTTVSEKRIHSFKHNQIYRNDVNVYVCSIMLEQSKEGTSLYELFLQIINLYSNPDSIFALEKLMKKCGVGEENVGLRFAMEKANNDIKIFNVEKLPKIEMEPPKGVTNVKYDVDCSFAENINISEFVAFVNHILP